MGRKYWASLTKVKYLNILRCVYRCAPGGNELTTIIIFVNVAGFRVFGEH